MSSRSPYSSRLWEPLDQWMESQGYYRKHTARDGSCLFRAVAEQVFLTQVLHSQVRMACVRFMERHKELFKECVEDSLEEHISSMQNPWEWGGELEMSVMSFMYRRDFLIFREIGVPPFEGTSNGFKDKILLCYLQNNQYDSVYPKEHIKVAAFCQSIVYHTLYERVFKLEETDYAVNKMLHDKSVRLRRDSCIAQLNAYTQVRKQLLSNANGKYEVKIEDIPIESKLSEEWYNNAKEILLHGIIPFPYKVAKALDPDIYRNIEFDVWNEMRKELRWGICNSMYPGDSGELRVGSKCLVRLESLPGKELHAHIQEMSHGKGPVLVYIEELAQKCTVQFDCLEPIPKALKNSHVEHGGERRPGLLDSSAISIRAVPTNAQSLPIEIPAFSKSHRGHAWNASLKSQKYNNQNLKDLPSGGTGGRNEGKTSSSSCKEGGGRKASGSKGRVRQVCQTSVSPPPQPPPRVNCQPSNLNQDQRYPQLMFPNQQLQLHLQPHPRGNPGNYPRQVTSFVDSNVPDFSNSVKPIPVSPLSCAPVSSNESRGNAAPMCPSNEAHRCGWQSQHNNHIITQVDHEEQQWSPPAVCCCCSFPVLEWRPGSSGGSQFSHCVLPSCGSSVPSIPSPTPSRPLPPGVCLTAPESVLLDGGDLPYSDIPTLRFFYNLGHDYLRSGQFSWPNQIPYPVQQSKAVVVEEEEGEGEVDSAITTNLQHSMCPMLAPVPNPMPANIPYGQPYPRQPLHPDQDEKINFSGPTPPNFGLTAQCQPHCGPLTDQGRARADMMLPVMSSPEVVPASEHEVDVTAGSGTERWMEIPHHSPSVPCIAMPQHSMPSPVLPYPSPQGALDGQFYVYTASSPPHPQGHHLMYGPIPQPLSHTPHLASTTRYMYPTVNTNMSHFALPHQ